MFQLQASGLRTNSCSLFSWNANSLDASYSQGALPNKKQQRSLSRGSWAVGKVGSRKRSMQRFRGSEREVGLRQGREAPHTVYSVSRTHTTAQEAPASPKRDHVMENRRVTWRSRLRAGQATIRRIQDGLPSSDR